MSAAFIKSSVITTLTVLAVIYAMRKLPVTSQLVDTALAG